MESPIFLLNIDSRILLRLFHSNKHFVYFIFTLYKKFSYIFFTFRKILVLNECFRLSNFKFGGQLCFFHINYSVILRINYSILAVFHEFFHHFFFVKFINFLCIFSFNINNFVSSQKFSLLDDHKFVNENRNEIKTIYCLSIFLFFGS